MRSMRCRAKCAWDALVAARICWPTGRREANGHRRIAGHRAAARTVSWIEALLSGEACAYTYGRAFIAENRHPRCADQRPMVVAIERSGVQA
jgi:hypothetical protein